MILTVEKARKAYRPEEDIVLLEVVKIEGGALEEVKRVVQEALSLM